MRASPMKHYGGNLSHRKHRSGFGGPTRSHRAEIARMANDQPPRRAEPMFASLAELFGNRSIARRGKPRTLRKRGWRRVITQLEDDPAIWAPSVKTSVPRKLGVADGAHMIVRCAGTWTGRQTTRVEIVGRRERTHCFRASTSPKNRC
jgi:hypothetical protein